MEKASHKSKDRDAGGDSSKSRKALLFKSFQNGLMLSFEGLDFLLPSPGVHDIRCVMDIDHVKASEKPKRSLDESVNVRSRIACMRNRKDRFTKLLVESEAPAEHSSRAQ